MLTSISVEEQHFFKPFGRFEGGPVVSVKSVLSLITKLAGLFDCLHCIQTRIHTTSRFCQDG